MITFITHFARRHLLRRKGGFQQRVLAYGATVAGLLIAEVLLRMVAPNVRLPFQANVQLENERGKFCKYDASLGWVGRPNVEDELVSLDCTYRVRQNRYGFRGGAHPIPRSQQKRLLVLGDSFAWGYGVAEGDLFTTRFERRAHPPVEVVNLGVSGYGTDQELLLYRQLGRQFQADQVLLVVTPYTDLWDNMTAVLYDDFPKPMFRLHRDVSGDRLELTNVPVPQRHQPWETGPQELMTGAPLLCRLAARWSVVATILNAGATFPWSRAWLESKRILPARQGADDSEVVIHVSPLASEMEQACDLMLALLRQFNAEVKQDRARLAILLAPSLADVDTEMWEDLKRRINNSRADLPPAAVPDRDQIRRRLTKFCQESGIDLIDPTDALRQAAEKNRYLYFPWNGHWTPAGHEIVKQLLAKHLTPAVSPPAQGH